MSTNEFRDSPDWFGGSRKKPAVRHKAATSEQDESLSGSVWMTPRQRITWSALIYIAFSAYLCNFISA